MTIANAIDRINDKLAGSDQPAVSTIEDALGLLADNIPQGGWGGTISPATADTLGGVKIGEGIDVTQDGTISAGGGYDLVIEMNDEHIDTATAGTVKSGTFAACQTKALTNREPLNVLVYGLKSDPDYPYTTTFGSASVKFNNYAEDPFINIVAIEGVAAYMNMVNIVVESDNSVQIGEAYSKQFDEL